jgi:acetyltransferase-like isoleucine patch superfamily enzyme
VILEKIIRKIRHIFKCFLLWSYNHVVSYIPFHTCRIAYLRHIIGIPIGRGSFVHIGCKFQYGVKIGNRCIIGRDCILWGEICIANDVSITAECYLFSSSHYVDDQEFTAYHKAVHICDRAWLGVRAVIPPGITVGEGAVLGANSLATHDLEPFGIYGGTPAKLIKYRNREIKYNLKYKTYFA